MRLREFAPPSAVPLCFETSPESLLRVLHQEAKSTPLLHRLFCPEEHHETATLHRRPRMDTTGELLENQDLVRSRNQQSGSK